MGAHARRRCRSMCWRELGPAKEYSPCAAARSELGAVLQELAGDGEQLQKLVPFARFPAEEEPTPTLVCSAKLPVAFASGLRFIDTPSVPPSDEG